MAELSDKKRPKFRKFISADLDHYSHLLEQFEMADNQQERIKKFYKVYRIYDNKRQAIDPVKLVRILQLDRRISKEDVLLILNKELQRNGQKDFDISLERSNLL